MNFLFYKVPEYFFFFVILEMIRWLVTTCWLESSKTDLGMEMQIKLSMTKCLVAEAASWDFVPTFGQDSSVTCCSAEIPLHVANSTSAGNVQPENHRERIDNLDPVWIGVLTTVYRFFWVEFSSYIVVIGSHLVVCNSQPLFMPLCLASPPSDPPWLSCCHPL